MITVSFTASQEKNDPEGALSINNGMRYDDFPIFLTEHTAFGP
jgi:hypothetical protein